MMDPVEINNIEIGIFQELITEKKIKDGKYIKVYIVLDNDRIRKIMISGDFFVYPESFIDSLEEHLMSGEVGVGEVEPIMKEFLAAQKGPIEFVGISYIEMIDIIVESLGKDRP